MDTQIQTLLQDLQDTLEKTNRRLAALEKAAAAQNDELPKTTQELADEVRALAGAVDSFTDMTDELGDRVQNLTKELAALRAALARR